MIQSVIANLKNLKLNQLEQLLPESLRQKAVQAVSTAAQTTELEIQKVVQAVVDKIIDGRDDVTEEVKHELATIVTEFHMTPQSVSSHLKDTGAFLLSRLPRTLDQVMNLRSSVALGLMSEAQNRIAARKAAEVTGKGKHKASHKAAHVAAPQEETAASESEKSTSTADATHVDGVEHAHIERGGRRRGRGEKHPH